MAAAPQVVQAQVRDPNPTGVNPFNGLSDDAKGAATFDRLYEAGAFEPEKKPTDAAAAQPEVETAPETPEAAAAAEPEVQDFANVEDYLQKSGIERDSFLSLPINVRVDGKDSQVPLAQVLKSYQLEQHVQQKSVALAEQQKAWEAERTEAKKTLDAQLNQAGELAKLAHQSLLADYQRIDWNRLRTEDPQQWLLLDREFNTRANAIQQHLAQVQQQQQQRAQEQQQEFGKNLQAEEQRMLERHPEWREPSTFKAAREEMSTYARKLGFTDAELQGIADHRYMDVLHDAAQFARLQAQAPQAVKRVRAAPQTANPGARTSRDPVQVARAQAKDAFMKNRKDPAAQERYFSTLA